MSDLLTLITRRREDADAARSLAGDRSNLRAIQPMRNFGSRNGMFTAVVGQFGKDRSQASNDDPVLAFLSAILRARAALENSHDKN